MSESISIESMSDEIEIYQDCYFQITKVDESKRRVYGRVSSSEVDRAKEAVDYGELKAAIQNWSRETFEASGGKSLGNVREMHKKDSCAGKFVKFDFMDEEEGVNGEAEVIDDQAWRKVLSGCYTGFSIGGGYKWKKKENDVTKYAPIIREISLVDRPAVASARFYDIQKADGTVEKGEFQSVEDNDPVQQDGTGSDAQADDQPASTPPLRLAEVDPDIDLPEPPTDTQAQAAEPMPDPDPINEPDIDADQIDPIPAVAPRGEAERMKRINNLADGLMPSHADVVAGEMRFPDVVKGDVMMFSDLYKFDESKHPRDHGRFSTATAQEPAKPKPKPNPSADSKLSQAERQQRAIEWFNTDGRKLPEYRQQFGESGPKYAKRVEKQMYERFGYSPLKHEYEMRRAKAEASKKEQDGWDNQGWLRNTVSFNKGDVVMFDDALAVVKAGPMLFNDLYKSEPEWDEQKHHRDEHGRFAPTGEQMAWGTGAAVGAGALVAGVMAGRRMLSHGIALNVARKAERDAFGNLVKAWGEHSKAHKVLSDFIKSAEAISESKSSITGLKTKLAGDLAAGLSEKSRALDIAKQAHADKASVRDALKEKLAGLRDKAKDLNEKYKSESEAAGHAPSQKAAKAHLDNSVKIEHELKVVNTEISTLAKPGGKNLIDLAEADLLPAKASLDIATAEHGELAGAIDATKSLVKSKEAELEGLIKTHNTAAETMHKEFPNLKKSKKAAHERMEEIVNAFDKERGRHADAWDAAQMKVSEVRNGSNVTDKLANKILARNVKKTKDYSLLVPQHVSDEITSHTRPILTQAKLFHDGEDAKAVRNAAYKAYVTSEKGARDRMRGEFSTGAEANVSDSAEHLLGARAGHAAHLEGMRAAMSAAGAKASEIEGELQGATLSGNRSWNIPQSVKDRAGEYKTRLAAFTKSLFESAEGAVGGVTKKIAGITLLGAGGALTDYMLERFFGITLGGTRINSDGTVAYQFVKDNRGKKENGGYLEVDKDGNVKNWDTTGPIRNMVNQNNNNNNQQGRVGGDFNSIKHRIDNLKANSGLKNAIQKDKFISGLDFSSIQDKDKQRQLLEMVNSNLKGKWSHNDISDYIDARYDLDDYASGHEGRQAGVADRKVIGALSGDTSALRNKLNNYLNGGGPGGGGGGNSYGEMNNADGPLMFNDLMKFDEAQHRRDNHGRFAHSGNATGASNYTALAAGLGATAIGAGLAYAAMKSKLKFKSTPAPLAHEAKPAVAEAVPVRRKVRDTENLKQDPELALRHNTREKISKLVGKDKAKRMSIGPEERDKAIDVLRTEGVAEIGGENRTLFSHEGYKTLVSSIEYGTDIGKSKAKKYTADSVYGDLLGLIRARKPLYAHDIEAYKRDLFRAENWPVISAEQSQKAQDMIDRARYRPASTNASRKPHKTPWSDTLEAAIENPGLFPKARVDHVESDHLKGSLVDGPAKKNAWSFNYHEAKKLNPDLGKRDALMFDDLFKAEFNESEHPRDKDGEFAPKGPAEAPKEESPTLDSGYNRKAMAGAHTAGLGAGPDGTREYTHAHHRYMMDHDEKYRAEHTQVIEETRGRMNYPADGTIGGAGLGALAGGGIGWKLGQSSLLRKPMAATAAAAVGGVMGIAGGIKGASARSTEDIGAWARAKAAMRGASKAAGNYGSKAYALTHTRAGVAGAVLGGLAGAVAVAPIGHSLGTFVGNMHDSLWTTRKVEKADGPLMFDDLMKRWDEEKHKRGEDGKFSDGAFSGANIAAGVGAYAGGQAAMMGLDRVTPAYEKLSGKWWAKKAIGVPAKIGVKQAIKNGALWSVKKLGGAGVGLAVGTAGMIAGESAMSSATGSAAKEVKEGSPYEAIGSSLGGIAGNIVGGHFGAKLIGGGGVKKAIASIIAGGVMGQLSDMGARAAIRSRS